MTKDHWPAVAAIYQQGIDTGNATFAIHPPHSWDEWGASKLSACSLVASTDEHIIGWAALGPVSKRQVYAGVAETSIYVRADARGMSIGDVLLRALIDRSEAQGIWTLQANIFPENRSSLGLHYKHGFHQVGIREKLGRMEYGPYCGQWRDVVLVEKRSKSVGI
jgi:phosphinothricin acetyltransferase